jgi:Fic family protein
MLFEPPELDGRELAVIAEIDDVRAQLNYLLRGPRRWLGHLRRGALARNIQASNAIEGYQVSLDDAAAAVAGGEPVGASETAWAAVANYRDAMTYILQLADDPHFQHSDGLIRSLHFMMTKHDLDAGPGLYRTGGVYIWSSETGNRLYDAPGHNDVPKLTVELADGLNTDRETPPLVKAGMAHLNLVMIHPFKDGNGRMARALQTLVLAREHILWPELSSIEEYLGHNTKEYYQVLGDVGGQNWEPDRDTRPWVRFVLAAHYRQASTLLHRAREAERIWAAVDERRAAVGLDERNLSTLYKATVSNRVDRNDHLEGANVSERVASADLKRMVDAGLLVPVGEKRGRYYVASDGLVALRAALSEPQPTLDDPFAGDGTR